MALRFTTDRRFTQTCRAADGETFRATFRLRPDAEHAAYDMADREGEIAFLRETVTNLQDLVDRDGEPLAFSTDLLDQALGFVDIRVALLRGYREGIVAAKSGN